jgi:catechol 2,3-dioxygenase-like lactoylglutathione lyase family enzyme
MVRFAGALSGPLAALLMTATAVPLAAQEARPPAPPGDVVGVGNIGHIVQDIDASLALYRDAMGLEVTVTAPFAPTEAIMKMGHTEGAQSRIAVLKLPGLAAGIELIEYKDIERKAQRPNFVDAGAANVSMRVRDLDGLFAKIEKVPGVKVLTAGGKPITLETPNGKLHAVFLQDPDGFVVELLDSMPRAGEPATGYVLSGGSFEPSVASSEASVKFYNELLGFSFKLGEKFNDNQTMASTAGAPGASFRQSTATIPGTSVPMTLIEFKGGPAKKTLSGRTQDPGTALLQLVVKDVTALTRKLKDAGVPIVSTGGAPVEVSPTLKIAIVRDPNNMLLELVERAPSR